MIKLGIIVVIVLLLLVAGGFAVYHFWLSKPEEVTTPEGEVDVPVSESADVLGDISETTEPGEDLGFDLTEEEPASRVFEAPTEAEETPTETGAPLEGPIDLSPEEIEPVLPGEPEEQPPLASEVSEPEPVTPEVTQPPREERPPEVTTMAEPTPTPKLPDVMGTPTPKPVSTPPVAAGKYSVRTLMPVLESKLPVIRSAMKKLGVKLQEQRTGPQQRIQAYRVAIGYFRTKAEATSWARKYLRPKGIDYYVYPARGMYSIQVGVYTQPQNVEKKMRELYQKFPGWRLPTRSERTVIGRASYHLSISKITESLGRKIQDVLFRMGVQAELAGI